MLDVRCLMFDAIGLNFNFLCYWQTSNIQHPASSIQHQTSSIKHQTSNIKHQTSSIKHQTSNIKHPASNIKSMSIIARYLTLEICKYVGFVLAVVVGIYVAVDFFETISWKQVFRFPRRLSFLYSKHLLSLPKFSRSASCWRSLSCSD